MKKIMLFAATCTALAACNISDIEKSDVSRTDGNAFVKGQKVVLMVSAGNDTKAAGTLDGDDISFTWPKGDEILVTVDGYAPAIFTLKGDGGSASGEFEGEMPGSGTTFSAQYPATEPDLTTQSYDQDHAIASGLMKFTATGCKVGSSFTLMPQCAVLRLNIYGIERKVSQIVVTNTTSTDSPKPSYSLNISPAVTISNDKNSPTPFFIVVPAGSSSWIFKTDVTSEAVAPSTYTLPKYPNNTEPNYGSGILIVSGSFATASAKTFTAGRILNMTPVSLTTVWAPVNCGYVPKTGNSGAALGYPYGKLYQWGRKDGQGYYKAGSGSTPTYKDATYPSGANLATGPISYIPTDSDAEKFYKNNISPCNWYSGTSPAPDALWGASRTTYDPCPEGWRVPTKAEIKALLGSHIGGGLQDGSGLHGGMKGKYFDGSSTAVPSSGVFFPAAGYRYYANGNVYERGTDGYYWSSSVDGNSAWYFDIDDRSAAVYDVSRADGLSVRCVLEQL